MTVQVFEGLLKAHPFKPFRVIMSSGQSYEVRHPEMAWLTRKDLLVGIDSLGDDLPSSFSTCSLLHITTVEPIENPAVK